MGWTNRRDANYPRVIYDFDTPVSVSTESPLLSLVELGSAHQSLAFTVRNHDLTRQCAFYLEQSESGVVTDDERETVYVAALKERTFESRDVMRLYWGITAAGDPDGSFPSVLVSFRVVGKVR